ncbi:hypothetical protein HNQ92_001673 [Rhabdobacter roseus]|uniref:Stress-response A/B barrel domain-containing protein n=1 Tax=Rhabdobacter roseus TaxID=1655419 RepID=A0A840TP76_9BACT|nr:Dabb family protein [Rhabdobacter roseus]MBB5283547.1 hypothetical protein [Rhabdobacter roseus]
MKRKNKTVGYLVPVFVLGLFMLIIYGAYVPHKVAESQRIVCVKFKPGTSNDAIEKHMREFAALRTSISDVVAYSGGKVSESTGGTSSYDVVHYLTFRTGDAAEKYTTHPKRLAFIEANQGAWEHVLEINSDIQK